jgi:hypothetical protein
MTETHADFLLYAGDRWQFDAALHDAAGDPLNLTDAAVEWRLHAGGIIFARRTLDDGISLINAVGGLCRIVMTPAQTTALASGTYYDDIRATLPGDFVSTQAVGRIIVLRAGSAVEAVQPDPCATLAQLEKARLDLLTGERVVTVNIANAGTMNYSVATMADLDRAIMRYEGLCAAQQGKRPRRFAARLGSLR